MLTKTVMILAAGQGTRLRPLTDKLPKPLVPVEDVALLARTLQWLARQGFQNIIVNAFYLAEQIEQLTEQLRPQISAQVVVLREETLLGTGGGIRNSLPYWQDDAIWVINGDVVIDIDIAALPPLPMPTDALLILRQDVQAKTLGPIYLQEHPVTNYQPIEGILNTGRTSTHPYMFTGLHYLTKDLAQRLPQQGCVIRDGYLQWLGHVAMYGYVNRGYWQEVGTPERYQQVQDDYRAKRIPWLS